VIAGLFIAWAGVFPAHAAAPCKSSSAVSEATPAAIRSSFRERKKTVVTFLGYSGAGYEDPAAMLQKAGEILREFDPAKTIVNIGATADGVGAVYQLAKDRGFETSGIVSTRRATRRHRCRRASIACST
jgi:hypothetical protein